MGGQGSLLVINVNLIHVRTGVKYSRVKYSRVKVTSDMKFILLSGMGIPGGRSRRCGCREGSWGQTGEGAQN